jgi:2'-5' RNA ligase
LAELAAATPPLAFAFSSVGAFPTAEGVLFLAPAANRDLLDLEVRVLDRLARFDTEITPYFRAGAWVPHCTLAVGLQPEQMASAMLACLQAFTLISGKFVQLAAVEIGTGQPSATCDVLSAELPGRPPRLTGGPVRRSPRRASRAVAVQVG